MDDISTVDRHVHNDTCTPINHHMDINGYLVKQGYHHFIDVHIKQGTERKNSKASSFFLCMYQGNFVELYVEQQSNHNFILIRAHSQM